jgi:hypothetical protein
MMALGRLQTFETRLTLRERIVRIGVDGKDEMVLVDGQPDAEAARTDAAEGDGFTRCIEG